MKAHIGPEYCINGTVIEIPFMLILVYIDVSLVGGMVLLLIQPWTWNVDEE